MVFERGNAVGRIRGRKRSGTGVPIYGEVGRMVGQGKVIRENRWRG